METSPIRLWRQHNQRRKELGALGKVIYATIVYEAPDGLAGRTPYALALIHIENSGKMIIGQLADVIPDEVKPGLKVVGQLRRLLNVPEKNLIAYGIKYTPVREVVDDA